jgi:hypothetical protein
MKTYPVDIDPEQFVNWVMAECQAQSPAVKATARRTTEMREIPIRREFHLGDQEREELSEIATVGVLEIAPLDARKGWLLTVLIEDEVGPRAPDDDDAPESDAEIDLNDFYDEFIRPERGNAYVIAEVENAAAKGRVTRLLNLVERNLHGSDQGGTKR